MNTKTKNIYIFGLITVSVISMTLVMFSVVPTQRVSAGWITSDIFGDGNHLTDDILGIDPKESTKSSSSSSNTGTCPTCLNLLSVSCTASPSSIQVGQSATFTPRVSGGNGLYIYTWSEACIGAGKTCSNVFSSVGTHTATVRVTSGGKSGSPICASAKCSVIVTQPPVPILSVSCSATPSSIQTGQSSTFTASPSGGTGTYTYAWLGTDDLSGSNSSISKIYSSAGTKTATVTVASGTQTQLANCSVIVTPPTTPNLAVSCVASPSSIITGQSSTFISAVSGGTGAYNYVWSGACIGTSSNCTNSFSNSGTQTAVVTVNSGNQTASASCPIVVNQIAIPNLSVSCVASPGSIQTGQSTTFTSAASGGTGAYNYLWSGACTGSSQACSNTFYTQGTQTASVTVTSGSQSNSASCSVNVGQSCTSNYQQRCSGSNLYWYDSCGVQQGLIQYCPNGCSGNACTNIVNNAALTVSKTVRNLTSGSGFANSTYASPSDMVMFMIVLQNPTGNNGQDAQNVFVRDMIPANLIYNNQLVVACTSNNNYNNNCNNNNYNYSGNIASGINLNTIYAGQTVTITYQVQVATAQNFAYGTTTLNNIVTTTSSNVGYIPTVSASVIVTKAGVLGASTISTGLTNNFWVDSFFLPLLLTLIGIWMWRSGMFFGIEKWLESKRKIRRGYKAQKELEIKIARIQKFGKA